MTNQKTNQQAQQIAEAQKRAEILKVPFKDLAGRNMEPDVLKVVPEEAASFYQFIPIGRKGNVLEVGMVSPDNLKAREALRFIALRNDLETQIYLITLADFEEIIRQYRTLHGEVNQALKALENELDTKDSQSKKKKAQDLSSEITAEAPVTKIVAVILRHAVDGHASDIHIEPIEKQVKVRFRVDGNLYTSLFLPKDVHSSIVTRVKILSHLRIDENRVPQDGRFRTVVDNKTIDFRVSTLPTSSGEKVVLRVLDPSVGLRSFEELGLTGYNLETLRSATSQPFGMILITGPTGSGKSTTLYAILNELNQEDVNIISLEDPVEYYIEGVNQSQIKPEIKYTFASGLRHVLRQDPDIIMVGEIRDAETADLAIHSALTGHIMLSTLHTNNAIGVVPRLLDMGISNFLLPASLNLAIAQRLVRRLCPQCKKTVEPSSSALQIIEEQLATLPEQHLESLNIKRPFTVCQAPGCKYCANKGTKGRIAIFEMLKMTPQLEEIIISEVSENKLVEESVRQGMITMKQDGIIKALQGVISFEEMLNTVEK